MYPYEVARMVEILGRTSNRHRAGHGQSPVPAGKNVRFQALRLVAGRRLIWLGETLAGRHPGPIVPLNASAPPQ